MNVLDSAYKKSRSMLYFRIKILPLTVSLCKNSNVLQVIKKNMLRQTTVELEEVGASIKEVCFRC